MISLLEGHDDSRWQEKKLKQLELLLNNITLVTSTESFKQRSLMELNSPSNTLYVFQREYATASREHVQYIGTDEVTTCVGLAIRNPESGLTSIGHFDSVKCVRRGVSEMVASVHPDKDTPLEVHLVGAYDDSLDLELENVDEDEDENERSDDRKSGHSWPTCLELVDALEASEYKMDIQTLCVLRHNTVRGDSGYHQPVIRGLAIETSSGRCMPAYFGEDARGPDPVVRGLSSSFAGSELARPYDTHSDSFSVGPFQWNRSWAEYAAYSRTISDADLLLTMSTSPYAEAPNFVRALRRMDAYLCENPDWEDTFPSNEPRKFVRGSSGGWLEVVNL